MNGIESQNALGKKLGYTDGSLPSKWRWGHQEIQEGSLLKLAACFDISFEEFMARVWSVHRALMGETEIPVPDGVVEIAGYGERRRFEGLSEKDRDVLMVSAEVMARRDDD